MSRSLKVNPQSILRVKQALQRNGFPSQKSLAEELEISTPTINKFFNSKPIDFANFTEICQKLGLDWREITSDSTPDPIVDLDQAPSNARFYGRARDREILTQWLGSDKCRVVAVLGMGGTGKTSLARKIVDEFVREGQKFNGVIWRNMEHAPSLEKLLEDLFGKFGMEWVASQEIFDRVNRLIEYLRQNRCLLVLDNIESLLQTGIVGGTFCDQYQNYEILLRGVARQDHQSCLLLTSRELPKVLKILLGDNRPVRELELAALELEVARKVLHDTGLRGTIEAENKLIEVYMFHPKLLQNVSLFIKQVYDSDIARFFDTNIVIYNGVEGILEEHYQRLPDIEKSILLWLTIFRDAVEEKILIDNILTTLQLPG